MLLVASSELSFRKTETPIRTILLGRSSSFGEGVHGSLIEKISKMISSDNQVDFEDILGLFRGYMYLGRVVGKIEKLESFNSKISV